MEDIGKIIQNLRNAPNILANLVKNIPADLLKKNRKNGKWCIHSHACHLAVSQPVLLDRFDKFIEQKQPEFRPYFPDKDFGESYLLTLDLEEHLKLFRLYRKNLVEKIDLVNNDFWDKKAIHPEYEIYTPYIMLRHIIMHDYLHMYRIEELWLTRPEYL